MSLNSVQSDGVHQHNITGIVFKGPLVKEADINKSCRSLLTHDRASFYQVGQKPFIHENLSNTFSILGIPLQHLPQELEEKLLLFAL